MPGILQNLGLQFQHPENTIHPDSSDNILHLTVTNDEALP